MPFLAPSLRNRVRIFLVLDSTSSRYTSICQPVRTVEAWNDAGKVFEIGRLGTYLDGDVAEHEEEPGQLLGVADLGVVRLLCRDKGGETCERVRWRDPVETRQSWTNGLAFEGPLEQLLQNLGAGLTTTTWT